MKTKNKIIKVLFILLLLFLSITLSACTKTNTDEKKEDEQIEQKDFYSVKVIDLDDEVIGEEKIETGKYTNLYEALCANFTVNGSIGDYGAYLTSINNSIIDKNWSLMVYVNGIQASTSCDKIIPNTSDNIEIKNECWACIDYGYGVTMDKYDVLLDKTIYHYLKTTMKDTLEKTTTYTGSTYWEMLTMDLVKRSGLDSNVINYQFSDELKKSINDTDINTLEGSNIGKYYIHARELDLVNKDFNNYYQTKLDELTSFNSYLTPFIIFPNSFIKLTSEGLNKVVNESIAFDITWGPTGNVWEITSQALFSDKNNAININDYLIDWEKAYDGGNSTDFCTVLMASSALGIDVRDTSKYNTLKYNDNDLDYLAYIFEKFYDESSMTVLVNNEKATMSTNQVYAGLISYKTFRYTNTFSNIFGEINKYLE